MKAFKYDPMSPQNAAYYGTSWKTKIVYGFVYITLVGFLSIMCQESDGALKEVTACHRAKNAYFAAINSQVDQQIIDRDKVVYRDCQHRIDSLLGGNVAAADETHALNTPLFASSNEIPLNDMMDYNFKTKAEIYDLRSKSVAEHPAFVGNDYVPSESVFGQIQDGKAWWGILGRSYYGNTDKSILGPSEESRFIGNPLLLVGLDSGHALKVPENSSLPPLPIYPVPSGLYWQNDGKQAGIRYDVTSFWEGEDRMHYVFSAEHKLLLVAYNARDFGWNYLYVSPEQSHNVEASPVLTEIKQFIHAGGSCGYPGGCNNMSPDQPELSIKVDKLPATAYIKLWKKAPADTSEPPDMIFVIQMI